MPAVEPVMRAVFPEKSMIMACLHFSISANGDRAEEESFDEFDAAILRASSRN
jgi:hypothetical protein